MITHRLNMDPKFKPIRQKRRKFAADRNKVINKKVEKLIHIDTVVDATAGHELLSFMDEFSGYNQILMHLADAEKTAFITERGAYCYKVMPFNLKNADATYQRLVNRMFANLIGKTMEVYIDDMLVKSQRQNSTSTTSSKPSRY